jgi:murein DD-endopeptidase MepM/ murein hydrolase activator NlpD
MAQPSSYVPDTALTSAPTSGFTANSVDPMRNAAPQQMEQMGDAANKVGETIDSIGARVQWQLDDAATKSAVTSFMQQSQKVLSGDGTDDNPGYLNTRGQQAIDGFAPARDTLAKIQQQGLAGLTDGLQKMMYNRVTTAHLTNFGATMADHHFQQNAIYSAQAANDESDAYLQSAVNASKSIGETDVNGDPSGNFYAFRNQAVQAKQHSLFIATGATPDSPQGTEAAKQVTTQIAQGVISQMLDNHDYKGAQAFYNSELEQGHIDERTAETLGAAVKRNTDVETVKDVSGQLISNALRKAAGLPTGINPQLPIQGGSYTMNKNDDGSQTFVVPGNTAVNAAADGKVSSITQDEDGGPYTMEVTHADGSTTQYGNLSAVNYKVGDAVMQGQQPIGLTAKGGLNYSMADKDGKAVDPSMQVLPVVDMTKFSDPVMAKAVIDQVNSSSYSPEMKAQMVQYVDSQQKSNWRQDQEMKAQTFSQASNAFYSGGMQWKQIPPSLFAQLPAEQQQHFMDMQTSEVLKKYDQGQAFKTMSETDIVSDFIANPDLITTDNVETARPKLSRATYLQLLGKANELAKNPSGVVEANAVSTRLKFFAGPAGIKTEPKTDAEKVTWNALNYSVDNAITQIKEQNKGKATAEQVDSAIKQALIQHTISTPRSAWNPLRVLGISPNETKQEYQFQMPAGATHVVHGSDGKMHYTDGKTDLGVVQ